ncbi:NADH dehydrogenase (ubiquinone) iron-sulfur protein, partial [Trifolium medium]|nr:NADH dehydrogenase (ubiquinone) iron-sulfur protein [Trifolium medium]
MLSECLNGYGVLSLSSDRCVRFVQEVAGVQDLGMLARGSGEEIGTYNTETIDDFTEAVGANIRIDSRGLEVMRIVPRLNE